MEKNIIKLNEAQFRTVIAESVKKVLKEWDDPNDTPQDKPTVFDIAANIGKLSTIVASSSAEQEMPKQVIDYWLPELYKACQEFIAVYDVPI